MPSPTTPFIHYVIETQHSGVDMRALVNGVELAHGTPDSPKITQEKINGWLKSGENLIEIYAAVPMPASPATPVNLKCLLFRGPMGLQPEEVRALLRFAQDDKTKLPSGSMRIVWQQSFRPDPFYGPWLWESAEPISQGTAVTEAALAIIRNVIGALNAHSGPEIASIFHTYVDEISRAYNQSAERLNAQLKSWTESWTPAPAYPLAASNYLIAVEETRRLVRVDRKDGLALFTVEAKAPGAGPKRVYLARTQRGGPLSDSGPSASAILTAVASVLLFLAVLSAGLIAWQMILQDRLARLPQVAGRMIRCLPVLSTTPDMPTGGNTPRNASMWTVEAHYQYSVGGTTYEGGTFSQRTVGKISNRAKWNDSPPESIVRLCRAYSAGSVVEIYYHPDNPRNSFVYFNSPLTEWGWAVPPLLSGLAAAVFFFFARLARTKG